MWHGGKDPAGKTFQLRRAKIGASLYRNDASPIRHSPVSINGGQTATAEMQADEECNRIGEILFVDRSGRSSPRVIRKCRIGSALSDQRFVIDPPIKTPLQ